MGDLLQVDPICNNCGGELLLKHFFLNTLDKKKCAYELIFECSQCEERDLLKFPLTIDYGGYNEEV